MAVRYDGDPYEGEKLHAWDEGAVKRTVMLRTRECSPWFNGRENPILSEMCKVTFTRSHPSVSACRLGRGVTELMAEFVMYWSA